MAIAILDIDGTLVDTNYQHALAWFRAFREHDIVLPTWVLHRHMGMGGDKLVEAVTDAATEREHGESLREAEKRHYRSMIDEVEPMEDARRLLEELKRRGHRTILASSAKEEELDHYLDLLDARDLVDDWTSSADVEETKPAPDLVQVALKKAGDHGKAVMVGDTPWDVKAAREAGVPTIAVRTGGFGDDELHESGAAAVYESVAELVQRLDETALA